MEFMTYAISYGRGINKTNVSAYRTASQKALAMLAIFAIMVMVVMPGGVQAVELEPVQEAVVQEEVTENVAETEPAPSLLSEISTPEVDCNYEDKGLKFWDWNDECEEESGTVTIRKFNCPEGLDFDNSLESPAKPDGSGYAVIPEGCVPGIGVLFGYIHEPEKNNNTAPYPGRDDDTEFTKIGSATDNDGVLITDDLPNGGRVDLAEIYSDKSVVSDYDMYGFMCNEDTGTKSDNYEVVYNAEGKNSYCNVYNKVNDFDIWGDKVVCLTEADLPNWGDIGTQAGEPSMIDSNTADEYVAESDGACWLEEDWTFQWGFAEKDNTGGVNVLPPDHIGQADGTSSLGMCNPTYCGNSTFTGANYADWKNFGTATSVGGTISAMASVDDLQGAPGIWVRENLKPGYVPFTFPPEPAPGSNVSAEIYCHDDIQNFDNYDEIINPQTGVTYSCVAFNALNAPTVNANKVVCLNESDLPNWGDDGVQAGEPAMITASTAADFVAANPNSCHLEEDWSFQWGFAEKDNTSGVNLLPGNHIGQADGTSTLGMCNPTYCGNNTFTGANYADWKNFDTSTSSNGAVAASVALMDLEGAPGVWVRENLQEGYVPFMFPPEPAPGSNISAEIYCHTDIQNFDNYDEIFSPEAGEVYYCVAFNAIEIDDGGGDDDCDDNQFLSKDVVIVDEVDYCGSITGVVFNDENDNGTQDEGEGQLSGWTVYLDLNDNGIQDDGEPTDVTESPYLFANLADGTYYVRQVVQGGWTQTFPADKHTAVISGGNDVTMKDFGNFSNDQGGCVVDCGGSNGGGSSRSSGSSSNSNNDDDGDVEGIDTGLGGVGPQPEVLGATLPRTGANLWLIAPIMGALFLLGGMLRTRKA